MISPGPVVLSGALVGAGVAVAVAGLRRPLPDLRSVLARLDESTAGPPSRLSRLDRGPWEPVLAWVADVARLRRLRSDLDLRGESAELLAARKVGFLLLGLAFPPVLSVAMAAIGLRLPWVLPGTAGVALAGVLFVVPDVDVRRRAAAARAELRRAVCAYLELVALERAADAGTVEALERAAGIGGSEGFRRTADALLRAQLAGSPAWQGLRDLAADSGVPELGDVADIMRLSGEDGAAVYATLRARAASLRTSLLADSTAQANAASEQMIVPVACLGLAFMVLVGFPAFARILFGS